MSKKKKPQLARWIEDQGISKVAKMLGVEKNTVRYWHSGHTLPRAALMLKVRHLSRISCDTMVSQFVN